MRFVWISVFLAVALAASLLVVRSPIDPDAYVSVADPILKGPLEPNKVLKEVEPLGQGWLKGPEDVELSRMGAIFTGVADGTVRRFGSAYAQSRPEVFADTQGRPLGLDFDSAGILWVADMQLGLLSVDRAGKVEVRATEAGVPVHFANDVDAASDGRIYFSDASTRFGPEELVLEVLEARPQGRLLVHDPDTGETRVLLEGLYFANGVAVAQDSSFVLVAETFRYRIRRLWLAGPRQGENEVLLDNAPGFPDGVSGTERGTFWVAIHSQRSRLLDQVLHPRPWLKRLVAWLPKAWLKQRSRYGLVLEIDGDGRILRSLHDPTGERIWGITSVEEHDGYLYVASMGADRIGRLRLP